MPPPNNCVLFLLIIVFSQLLLIIYLLSALNHKNDASSTSDNYSLISTTAVTMEGCRDQISKAILNVEKTRRIKGVAATLMLHSPTWFQRRYTYMIQNAHNNIPPDWVIQVFYTGEGQSLHGIDINPWIRTLVDSGRLVLTVIPPHILKLKRKRVELMVEKWIWEHMLADRVLIFGGSSVICSNSPWNTTHFEQFDYIGAPWNSYKGVGGDGGISIRNRNVMLALLTYEYKKLEEKGLDAKEMAVAHKKWGQEDHFFISRYLEIANLQLKTKRNFTISLRWRTSSPDFVDSVSNRLPEERVVEVNFGAVAVATKEQTLRFAGNNGEVNFQNWAILGTLPNVNFQQRDQVIGYCPEIKMHYPALHDPNCFGAAPDGDKCALNICALKPKSERKGGC